MFLIYSSGDKYDGSNDKDILLEEFSAVVAEVATEFKCIVIDLRHHILQYLEKFNEENLSHSILTYDGIHLNEAGHLLLAAIFLQSIGFDNRNLLDNPILDREILKNQFKGRRKISNTNSREEIRQREDSNSRFEREESNYRDDMGRRGNNQHGEF